jgi:translocator protein
MTVTADRRKWPALGAFILACYSAAAIGGLFMPGEWYAQLAKPEWTPPDWVFAPVWTVLYTVMAVAGWLVWRTRGLGGAQQAFTFFGAQLILNAAWSWIFFGRQQPGLAAIEIVMLWVAIAATIVAFWRIRPMAGALLLPYLAWVSFAAALNFAIWRLNA